MATTTAPSAKPKTKPRSVGGGNGPKGNGKGPDGPGGPRDPKRPLDPYRLGMWVGLAGVAMLFAALTSAYVVTYGQRVEKGNWESIALPNAVWLSTACLLGSSLTLELARRALRQDGQQSFHRWLAATTVLGTGFLLGQIVAWRQLVAQGIYIGSNPHSSFFYVLTGTHGVHLLGGMVALLYVVVGALRHRFTAGRRRAVDVTAIYWHFMDGLWIYLLLLLSIWR